MVGRPRGNVVSSPDVGQESVARNQSAGELGGSSVPEGRRSSWLDGLVGWLTTHGERAGNVLIYSSAYLAFIAMIEVTIVMVLLSLSPNPAPVVLGFVAFSVYASDKIVDVDTDAATNPEQANFIRRHKNTLYVLAAISYGLAVSLSVLGGPVALTITLLPGIFWVLYATNWIPDIGIHIQRLKEVLVLNSAVVALAWAISLTFLPLAFADANINSTTAFVFIYFFLRSFVDTEIPNIRDVDSDRAIGVKTLPVVLGVEWTRRVIYGVDFLTAVLIMFGVIYGNFHFYLSVPLLVGIGFSLCLTWCFGRYGDGELFAVMTELEYLVVALSFVPFLYGF